MSVTLREDGHPMATVTRRNFDKSLFLKMLPLEVRGMIYEYALTVAEDIVPQQSTRHSYKFCWGRSREYRFSTVDGASHVDLSPIGDQLTVAQLERSCYSIRKDLEYHSTFYKVNTFKFYHLDVLLCYLASITPKRREQLRSISLEFLFLNIPSAVFGPVGVQTAMYSQEPALVLLGQCKSLEKLEIIVNLRLTYQCYGLNFWDLQDIIANVENLRSQINKSYNDGAFRVFELPLAIVLLRLSPDVCFSTTEMISTLVDNNGSLDNLYHEPSVQRLLHDESFQRPFSRFCQALKDQKSMSEAVWKRMRESITSNDIRLATIAADIDLPGYTRVIGGTVGQGDISHSICTRTKTLQPDEHDKFGVLSRRNDKYDADGLLLWNFTVSALRWNGTDIEFEATYARCLRHREPSWESLVALPTQHKQGLGKIASFYRRLDFRVRELIDSQHREVLKKVPEPAAVIRVCFDGKMPCRWKTLQSSFKKNQTRLRKYETKLRKRAKQTKPENTGAEDADTEEDYAEGDSVGGE